MVIKMCKYYYITKNSSDNIFQKGDNVFIDSYSKDLYIERNNKTLTFKREKYNNFKYDFEADDITEMYERIHSKKYHDVWFSKNEIDPIRIYKEDEEEDKDDEN